MKEDIIDKYDQEWLWIVLRLTQSKGNLYDAITSLHTENDIFSLLDHLQRLRYFFFDGEKKQFIFTKKGESLFTTLTRKLKKRGLYRYIIPNLNKRNIYDTDEFYIPNRKNAKWLL
jgi:hypothetical protein